jgi:hypothetical protein
MASDRVAEMFRRVGVEPPPREGPGVDLFYAAHLYAFWPLPRPRADDVLHSPFTNMMNSRPFLERASRAIGRGFSAPSFCGRDFPRLSVREDGTANAAELAAALRAEARDRSDANEEGFFVALAAEVGPGGAHAWGLELKRGGADPDANDYALAVYNSHDSASSPRSVLGRLLLFEAGRALPFDRELALTMGWRDPLEPGFPSRGDVSAALPTIRASMALGLALSAPEPPASEARAAAALRLAGVRAFEPAFACQVGRDGLCQTWVPWLYRRRALAGGLREATLLVDAETLSERRRSLFAFAAEMLRTDAAREYWAKRAPRRGAWRPGPPEVTPGSAVLEWLLWATEDERFARDFFACATGALGAVEGPAAEFVRPRA